MKKIARNEGRRVSQAALRANLSRSMGVLFDRDSLLRSAHVYLRDCYASRTRATVGEFAQHLHLDRSYVSRIFMEIFAVSALDVLRGLQVDHAKALLKRHAYTIEEVAHRCGFGTRNTFYRVFSAQVGMSPHEYREHSAK